MSLRGKLVPIAVGAAVAGLLFTVTSAFGDSGSGVGVTLQGGASVAVGCSGSALSFAQTDPTDGTAACAPVTTTTTVAPTTTTSSTTLPVTTTTVPVTTTTTTPSTGALDACSLPVATAAFCDTFGAPMTNGPANGRAGQLDGVLWGTSEVSSISADDFIPNDTNGLLNDGERQTACPSSGPVEYPQNIVICNGQLQETTRDGEEVSSLAMYPRQPFNFAGRTGTITFDVSDNSQSSHSAWPELWVTDSPAPDPFTHFDTWQSLPANGFGIRFSACDGSTRDPVGGCFPQPGPTGEPGGTVGVDSAIVVNNYQENDTANGGNLDLQGYTNDSVTPGGGAITEAALPGQTNHFQVTVSQNDIEVYGTNAFAGTWDPAANPLHHLASILNANLQFTQGLVWLEDVHYNGDKFNSQQTNTLTWSNVGFDGPVLPRDLGFDVPANDAPETIGGDPGAQTGYDTPAGGFINLTAPGVTPPDIAAATGALVTFNFEPANNATPDSTVRIGVNGNEIDTPWPFAQLNGETTRTLAVPVPLADLVPGDNTLTFYGGSSYTEGVYNVDLILQGAGGVVQP